MEHVIYFFFAIVSILLIISSFTDQKQLEPKSKLKKTNDFKDFELQPSTDSDELSSEFDERLSTKIKEKGKSKGKRRSN